MLQFDSDKQLQQNENEGSVMKRQQRSSSDTRNEKYTFTQQVFAVYFQTLADRTRERHRKELEDVRKFLEDNGKPVGNLALDATTWSSLVSDDIERFLLSLRKKNYSATSIRDKLYTIKTYARLSAEAGFFNWDEYKQLGTIKIEPNVEGQPRIGKKKLEPILLTQEQVAKLLSQPNTVRGRSDQLLIAVCLLCGLWPREISALNRRSFHLEKGTLTFYSYHTEEEQTLQLDTVTLEAARRYLQNDSPYQALFIGNRKESTTELRLTDRAINTRVRTLGEQIHISGLSPHDCHLYWEREQVRTRESDYVQQQSSQHGTLFMLDDLDQLPRTERPSRRKGRPDIFNRHTFESALRSQDVPDPLISPLIGDIRLLIPLLIQQVGEETFRKIADEHRNTLKISSQTEMWEKAVHHLVVWADNEINRYIEQKEK